MNKFFATAMTAASLAITPLGANAAHATVQQAAAPASASAPARIHCDGTVFATPFKYSKPMESPCGVSGSPGWKVTYNWAVNSESDAGRACLEGWGFDDAHPKGGWFSLGCGKGGSAQVPWGNVLAMPKVRAQSLNVPMGTFVDWNH